MKVRVVYGDLLVLISVGTGGKTVIVEGTVMVVDLAEVHVVRMLLPLTRLVMVTRVVDAGAPGAVTVAVETAGHVEPLACLVTVTVEGTPDCAGVPKDAPVTVTVIPAGQVGPLACLVTVMVPGAPRRLPGGVTVTVEPAAHAEPLA